jgi:hypothetical protein
MPEGESPALEGPGGIDRTSIVPKNTVIIGFFFERKTFFPRSGGDPAAIGLHKINILHSTLRRQKFYIFFGKKHETALIPAAGRTPGTGKTEPAGIKGLILCHARRPRLVLETINTPFRLLLP